MTTIEKQERTNPSGPATTRGVGPPDAAAIERELATVRRRLERQFGDSFPVEVIHATFDAQAARWAEARMRTFVPLLVERYSVEGLRRMHARC